MVSHIALLGDSIFDNRSYTGTEPDVLAHLRSLLPSTWRASLLAVDGSTTGELASQLSGVSDDVTHLVISVGGNDALLNSDLLARPVNSTTEALTLFGDRVTHFESAYRRAIGAVLTLERETTVCTIYNGNLEGVQGRLARVALTMFNDVILRIAFEERLPVIDLRLICTEPEDYANPIEPSGRGGRKIATAITIALGLVDGGVRHSRVHVG